MNSESKHMKILTENLRYYLKKEFYKKLFKLLNFFKRLIFLNKKGFLLSKKIEMFSVSIYTKRSQTKVSSSKKKK